MVDAYAPPRPSRLCCEECFVSNLKSADEPAFGPNGWKSYPEKLDHCFAWQAIHSLVKQLTKKDEMSKESFLPDAHTLYMMRDEFGMCQAVNEEIQDRQMEMVNRISNLMKQKLKVTR